MSVEFAQVVVSGRVQGVGYRQFVWRAAQAHGIGGSVWNRSDGTVEARLIGAADAIAAMLAELERGPPGARVARVDVVQRGLTAPEGDFVIRIAI